MNFRDYDFIQNEEKFKGILENTFLKTSASRVKIPELFDMTHYAMKCFSQKDSLGKVEWTEVTEDEIFEKLREYFMYLQLDDIEYLERRIYFIQGDTGTGKSELCMYLKNNLEQEFPEDLILIPIWKNQSWTQICGETLPNKFIDILKDERFSDILNDEKYKHLFYDRLEEHQYFSKFLEELRDPGKKERIAGAFAIGILNLLRDKGYVEDAVVSQSRYGDFENANPIRVHLVKNMDNLLHSTRESPHDDSEQFYVFESNDVDDLKLRITPHHRLEQESIANEMENALQEQIKANYNIKDMNEILESFNNALEIIQKETGNKNLRFLLIFEDFALRGNDLEDFINFISSDSLNNFNYIIAGTFDKIDRIEEHTLEARSEYLFTTKRGEKEKQTPFLSDKTASDFVYNYMNYLKKKLGLDIDLLNEVEIFFPLSRVFVTKLYQNMKGDNLKPRDFLKIIHLLMYEFCNTHAFPFISAKELPYDEDLPLGIEDSYLNDLEIFEDDAIFISWYGVKITGTVQIEEHLCEQFGFENGYVELTKESIDPFEKFVPSDGEKNEDEEVPEPPAPPTPQEEFNNILNELFNEVKPFIKTWINNPKTELENDLDYYFSNGIKEILEELTNDFKIYNVFHFYKGQTDFLEARLEYISDINERFTIQVSDNELKLNLISLNLKSFIYRVIKLGILHFKSSKFRNYSDLRHNKINGLIEELTEDHIHNLLNLKSNFEILVFKKITNDFFLYTISRTKVDRLDDNIDTFLFFFYTLKYIMIFLQSPLTDLADLSLIKKSLYNPNNIGNSSLIQISSIQTGNKLNNFIKTSDKIQDILINLILNSTDNIRKKLIDIIYKMNPDGTLTLKYVPESLINYFFDITRKTPGNKGILSDIKINNVNFVGTNNSVLSSIKDFKQYINDHSISENEEIVKTLTSQFNNSKLLLKEIFFVDIEKNLRDYLRKHPNLEQHSAIKDELSYFVRQLSSTQYRSLLEIGDSLDQNLKNLYTNILTQRFFLEDIVDSLNDNDLIKSYKELKEKLKDPMQSLDKNPIENILEVIKNDNN